MALFSLKKISMEAAGRRAYLRGVECYNAGKVRRFQREAGEFYPEFITAQVENDARDGSFQVEIGFDEEGEADYYACECEPFHQEEGACKHIVAVMVHKYYADMVAGMAGSAEPLNRQESAAARTDEAARRMIDRYLAGQAVQMVAESSSKAEKVSLTPVLQWGYRQAELTFLVGGARPYVIKDLSKFYADMQKHEVVEYGKQLRTKQFAKRYYGVLEGQFRHYFELATKMTGVTGENLLRLLESRLDNVVYRLGFAASRAEARQLVTQGHFTVDGRKVNVPSYLVKPGQVVAMKEGSRQLEKMKAIIEANSARPVPQWLDLDRANQSAKVVSLANREDIDLPIEETLIVELYSK